MGSIASKIASKHVGGGRLDWMKGWVSVTSRRLGLAVDLRNFPRVGSGKSIESSCQALITSLNYPINNQSDG